MIAIARGLYIVELVFSWMPNGAVQIIEDNSSLLHCFKDLLLWKVWEGALRLFGISEWIRLLRTHCWFSFSYCPLKHVLEGALPWIGSSELGASPQSKDTPPSRPTFLPLPPQHTTLNTQHTTIWTQNTTPYHLLPLSLLTPLFLLSLPSISRFHDK